MDADHIMYAGWFRATSSMQSTCYDKSTTLPPPMLDALSCMCSHLSRYACSKQPRGAASVLLPLQLLHVDQSSHYALLQTQLKDAEVSIAGSTRKATEAHRTDYAFRLSCRRTDVSGNICRSVSYSWEGCQLVIVRVRCPSQLGFPRDHSTALVLPRWLLVQLGFMMSATESAQYPLSTHCSALPNAKRAKLDVLVGKQLLLKNGTIAGGSLLDPLVLNRSSVHPKQPVKNAKLM